MRDLLLHDADATSRAAVADLTERGAAEMVASSGRDERRRRLSPGGVIIGLVGLLWVAIGLVGTQYGGKLTSAQKNDSASYLPRAAESTKEASESRLYQSVQAIPGFVVYQRPGGLTAADKAAISKEARTFRSIPGVLAAEVGSPQYAADRATGSVAVPYAGTQSAVSLQSKGFAQAVKSVSQAARAGAPPGLIVHGAGPGPLFVATIDAFSGIDGTLLLAAGIVVCIVLLVVYRSPFLWLLPVFSVILALGSAAFVIYLLVRHGVLTINGQSQAILCILVPGVGTDYALLLTCRYRDELHNHQSRLKAMTVAWKRASTAIVSSACTVSLGLLCLTLAKLNSARSLGPVCAIGIACTMAVMLSFLPLALTAMPRGVFWPRVPRPDQHSGVVERSPWTRFAAAIGRHDRRAWVGATLVLLLCALAMSTLKTGGLSSTQSYTNRPDAVVGQGIYNAHFLGGTGEPAEITARVQAIPQVRAAVAEVPGVAKTPDAVCVAPDLAKLARLAASRSGPAGSSRCAPAGLTVAPRNGRLLVDATLEYNYDSPQAYHTIQRIRSAVHAIPGADALVGGAAATNYDTNQASRHDRDLIIPVILLVILVVLALLLRAIVAPVLLILSVVLSFTAALGISALFFNHVFHFANADPIFPLLVFVFLVALGVDYNIFLMTRVREETLLHGTADGVLRGLAVTGGVITSAGIVLAATFAVLVVLPLVFLAEVAFTIALGVLIDTVIVRSILVPALCHDLGKQIWWPSQLAASAAHLPRIHRFNQEQSERLPNPTKRGFPRAGWLRFPQPPVATRQLLEHRPAHWFARQRRPRPHIEHRGGDLPFNRPLFDRTALCKRVVGKHRAALEFCDDTNHNGRTDPCTNHHGRTDPCPNHHGSTDHYADRAVAMGGAASRIGTLPTASSCAPPFEEGPADVGPRLDVYVSDRVYHRQRLDITVS